MDFFEKYMNQRCKEVRKDISNCWRMLKGITKDEEILASGLNDQSVSESVKKLSCKIKCLKSQFKYFNECKVFPNFVKTEGLPLRLDFTSNKKYIFVGGSGCKLIRRNLRDFNDKKFSKSCKSEFNSSNFNLGLDYDTYGMVVDKKDRLWIHEGATNKLIGFDHELNGKYTFEGNGSFDSKGLSTTEVLAINESKTKLYWHKGQGFLSQIDPLEGTETVLGDSISDTEHLIKMLVTNDEMRLVALESDYSTLQLYDLKTQKRIDTCTYSNS